MSKNIGENLCRKILAKNPVENKVKKYLKYSVIF